MKKTVRHRLSQSDLLAIQQLNARYAHAFDNLVPNPAAAWARTFTPDGCFVLVTTEGQLVAKARGTKRLMELHASFQHGAAVRHWFTNLAIDAQRNGARMTALIMVLHVDADPARIARTGVYSDRLVKLQGTWRFKERKVTLDPGSPN